MKNIKALIIEDEKPAAKRLEKMLAIANEQLVILDILESVEDSVDWLKSNPEPDLIFMDIQLSDGICFEIFEHIQTTVPVIFTTAFDQYAIQAFQANSIDYLLKPIEEKDLAKSLSKFETIRQKYSLPSDETNLSNLLKQYSTLNKTYRSRLLLKTGNHYKTVFTNEIAFLCIQETGPVIYTFNQEKFFTDKNLDDYETMMDPEQFFRINRQMIVNIKSVANIQQYLNSRLKLTLKPGLDKDVIVSREKVALFKEWLNK